MVSVIRELTVYLSKVNNKVTRAVSADVFLKRNFIADMGQVFIYRDIT